MQYELDLDAHELRHGHTEPVRSMPNKARVTPDGIDVERVAFALMNAMGSAAKAASVTRRGVQALLAAGSTIKDRNVIALELAAIRLDELAKIVNAEGKPVYGD